MARRSATAPVTLGSTAYVAFIATDTGAPTAADSTPTAKVYAASSLASDEDMGVPVTVTAVTGKAGFYVASFDATSGNGFGAGENYVLVIEYEISTTAYADLVDVPVV